MVKGFLLFLLGLILIVGRFIFGGTFKMMFRYYISNSIPEKKDKNLYFPKKASGCTNIFFGFGDLMSLT